MRPKLINGDVKDVLKTLDPESIQCVVTSPPYWNQRNYGVDDQLGLEATSQEYVDNMVSVFQEVKRVLRKDGTVWLNLGDSFQDKNLVGIPWRVALALQADGWYLRSDIIWHKPAVMPEPVKDRLTKCHEYIFLLTKSTKYYYDHEAIKEPVKASSIKRSLHGWDCDRPSTKNASMDGEGIHTDKMGTRFVDPSGRNKRTVWTMNTSNYKDAHFATFPEELPEICIKAGTKKGDVVLDIFVGSGTTCRVASKLGRNSIGIDLNKEYLEIAKRRCKIDSYSLDNYK